MNDEESLDCAINEPVAIYSYNDAWPLLFEQERARLLRFFPSDFLAIEHIGSTAVPGLSAKPVIDIMAGVESMLCADVLMELLCQAKYTTSMEFNASLVGWRWLMRWADGRRTHHLHLMVYGSKEWQERLVFRNTLRASAKTALLYEQIKQAWAVEFSLDREAYTAAKGAFIQATRQYNANQPPSLTCHLGHHMKSVIQEEISGCGIAASAALAGVGYAQAKAIANAVGIHAEDPKLWSETTHVRKLLQAMGLSASPEEAPFESWERLPDKALLAIRWRIEQGKPFWHWVVFVRENGEATVLDSKKALATNVRRDFWRMKPKWYISVH